MPGSFAGRARSASRPVTDALGRVGHTLRTYNLEKARGDLMAGGTVAVVATPQTMAYAIIAGLGVLTLGVVVGFHAISRLIPGPLIAVVATAEIVAGMGWTGDQLGLAPAFERTLPRPILPTFPLALSLLVLMEAYSIA